VSVKLICTVRYSPATIIFHRHLRSHGGGSGASEAGPPSCGRRRQGRSVKFSATACFRQGASRCSELVEGRTLQGCLGCAACSGPR